MTVPTPHGLDWEVWRVVSSGRISASPQEILHSWTYEELVDAHAALDVWDRLEVESMRARK